MKKYLKVLIGILIVSNLFGNEPIEKSIKAPSLNAPFAHSYYSAISERLSAWVPVGSGLKAVVIIRIKPDGKFDYEMIKESTSQEFNDSLKAFLEKQKDIRYPVYKNREFRTYIDFKSKG